MSSIKNVFLGYAPTRSWSLITQLLHSVGPVISGSGSGNGSGRDSECLSFLEGEGVALVSSFFSLLEALPPPGGNH